MIALLRNPEAVEAAGAIVTGAALVVVLAVAAVRLVGGA